MNKKTTLSIKLWNIAVTASVKSINGELSEKEYLKETKRFEEILNAAIKK